MTWTVTLPGRRDTYDIGLVLVTRLGAAGLRWSPHSLWQAWHFLTGIFILRGRRGTYGTGLVLMTYLGAAWLRLVTAHGTSTLD